MGGNVGNGGGGGGSERGSGSDSGGVEEGLHPIDRGQGRRVVMVVGWAGAAAMAVVVGVVAEVQ